MAPFSQSPVYKEYETNSKSLFPIFINLFVYFSQSKKKYLHVAMWSFCIYILFQWVENVKAPT